MRNMFFVLGLKAFWQLYRYHTLQVYNLIAVNGHFRD